MALFQAKCGDETYICSADSIREAMAIVEAEAERREGVAMTVTLIKEVDARLIGQPETGPQARRWPTQES